MANVMVPSLYPGERSLPAELRVGRGVGFAERRMAASVQPSASPTFMNFRRLRGMGGLGQDPSDGGSTFDPSSSVTLSFPQSGTLDPLDPTTGAIVSSSVGLNNPLSTSTGVNVSGYFQQLGVDPTTTGYAAGYASAPAGYTGPTVAGPSASTPAAPSGYQWATLINQSGQNIAKILTIAGGGSSVTLPNGTQLLYGSNSGASAASALASIAGATGLSSNTLILVGLGAVVFFMMKK